MSSKATTCRGHWKNKMRWAMKCLWAVFVGVFTIRNFRQLPPSPNDNFSDAPSKNFPANSFVRLNLESFNASTISVPAKKYAPSSTNATSMSNEFVVIVNTPSNTSMNTNGTPTSNDNSGTILNVSSNIPNGEKNVTTLKIPTPVLLASLPKSGTTSVWKYFLCGGIKASHLYVKLNASEALRFEGEPSVISGRCMKRNVMENRTFLEGCGDYQVFTDTGFIKGRPALSCYYPGIEGLHDYYKSYPNGTLMYIVRNTTAWRKSVTKWTHGLLLKRWERCKLRGFRNRTAEGIEGFYEWHKQLVRDFARSHPSMTYIEAELESQEIASLLESRIGISASCWKDCDPKERICHDNTVSQP